MRTMQKFLKVIDIVLYLLKVYMIIVRGLMDYKRLDMQQLPIMLKP